MVPRTGIEHQYQRLLQVLIFFGAPVRAAFPLYYLILWAIKLHHRSAVDKVD